MDGERFDRLARCLAAPRSRRVVLRTVLGAAGGGLLSVAELRGVDASSCGTFCNALPPGRQRGECARACGQGIPGGLFAECDGDQSRLCQAASGTFACCAGGETCCDGVCVDARSDVVNCGGCGVVCPPPSGVGAAVCIASVCGVECAPERTLCGNACADILTDPDHCGGCDEACAEEQACCGGVCVDTQRDEANCGACGTTCHPHATCFDGVCRCCQGGTVECGPFSTDQICCDFPLTAVKCCNALCDDPGLDCVLFCIDCGIGLECDFGAFCPPGYGLQPGAGGPEPGACVG